MAGAAHRGSFRIGINALYLIPGGVGGTEIYLRNLLQALARIDAVNQYCVFTNRETGSDLIPAAANFRVCPQAVAARIRPARILWEQTALPVDARRLNLDVMLNPGFTCPVIGCPNVTVFHDLQHRRHPEYFRWFDLPFWRMLLRASVMRSRALIAVSEATRDDLRKYYGVDATVVHHGVEAAFFDVAQGRRPADYLLCVSTSHPHKNLDRLLRVHEASPDLPELVITGLRGFAASRLERSAGARVRFTGWVPREELYGLFRGAVAFVYPSQFEGFGMPVLEAMAAGVPVACSDIRPLREIADGCAIFFDPGSDEAMQVALRRVVRDVGLVETARARASGFAWETAARATLEVLGKAAGVSLKTKRVR